MTVIGITIIIIYNYNINKLYYIIINYYSTNKIYYIITRYYNVNKIYNIIIHYYNINKIHLTQNYFGDPWNTLDFIIVVGSIVDIVIGKLLVSNVLVSLNELDEIKYVWNYIQWKFKVLISNNLVIIKN